MTFETIMMYFAQYGEIAIFVIILLEYLNLPGFPAGVIMPLAGLWAAEGNINFLEALAISVAAGLIGSLVLYYLGWCGGNAFLKMYIKRFPKQKNAIEKNMDIIRQKGAVGVFVSKLIPMLRTLISIPAGVVKMNLMTYIVSSVLGIFLWNLAFMGVGYFFGDMILSNYM